MTPDEMRKAAADLLRAAEEADQQLDREALATMKPHEIEAARAAGRLDVLMGGDDTLATAIRRSKTEQLTATDARVLSKAGRHDLITAAHDDGRFDPMSYYDTEETA